MTQIPAGFKQAPALEGFNETVQPLYYCKGEDGKVDPDKLAKVAKANKVDLDKYSHLNIGMQRMNVGNRLRGMHNKGEKVKVGKTAIEGKEQTEKVSA